MPAVGAIGSLVAAAGQQPDGKRADEQHPDDGGQGPCGDEQRVAPVHRRVAGGVDDVVGERQTGDAAGDEGPGEGGGAVSRRRTRRPARQGATGGMRAIVRAGHHAAPAAVTTASRLPATISHHGTLKASTRYPAASSTRGARAIQPATPTTVPATAATAPATAPLATITRRICLLGRADGGEHAQLPQASLRDDDEAGGGDEGDEEQRHGGEGRARSRRPPRPRRASPLLVIIT